MCVFCVTFLFYVCVLFELLECFHWNVAPVLSQPCVSPTVYVFHYIKHLWYVYMYYVRVMLACELHVLYIHMGYSAIHSEMQAGNESVIKF